MEKTPMGKIMDLIASEKVGTTATKAAEALRLDRKYVKRVLDLMTKDGVLETYKNPRGAFNPIWYSFTDKGRMIHGLR